MMRIDESPLKQKWQVFSDNTQATSTKATKEKPSRIDIKTTQLQTTTDQSYNDILCSHLYHNCFAHGLYSDLNLKFSKSAHSNHQLKFPSEGTLFKLHRIMATRCPLIASILSDLDKNDRYSLPLEINVVVTDQNITVEGLSIALGHLYGSYSQTMFIALIKEKATSKSETGVLLRSVLASASWLGLSDLVDSASELIKHDVDETSVFEYCQFVNQCSASEIDYSNVANELKAIIFSYLSKGLVKEVSERYGPIWANKEGTGYQYLVSKFKLLPFEWLKQIVESKSFQVSSDMDRYYFAKQVIKARSSISRCEENVLLAFGSDGDKSGVTIVRKAVKPGNSHSDRRIWKAQQ